jgi:DNA-binding transcriptional LysR family regulator
MDEAAAMRMFVQVVRAESFSAAARRLDLTPSSVSRAVSGLEDELGVRLLNRTTRRLRLTEAGQVYYEHAARIATELDDARRAVSELQAVPRGLLRVSAPLAFGRVHVAPMLPQFLRNHPQVEIEFLTTDQLVDLVEEGIDVAVRIGALPDSTLIARRLTGLTRVVCASPAYLEREGEPRCAEDLASHQCLTFRFNTAGSLWRPGSNVWRLSDEHGVRDVQVSGRLRSNSPHALVGAALEGLGLILMPRWLVFEHLESGVLRSVLDDYHVSPSAIESAIYAVYPSSRHVTPKLRAFVDHLAEHFEDASF